MKWLVLKLILLAFVVYKVPKFCHEKTDGFALTKIHSNLSYDLRWDVECGPLPDVFRQKFIYLAAGGQAYAFLSEDGTVVLKLFKHHLRRVPFWLKILPLPASLAKKRDTQRDKRGKKLLRDFRSYKLAYEKLAEETGLLYVHLNKTKCLSMKARLIDKIGIAHVINLDEVEFVLQRRADLVFSHFLSLIQENKIEEAKERINSICALIQSRCKKGIYDEDPRIHRNVGFVEDRAIIVDVGRLKKDPRRQDPSVQKKDLIAITSRLQTFFADKSPELARYLEKKLHD